METLPKVIKVTKGLFYDSGEDEDRPNCPGKLTMSLRACDVFVATID